MVLNTNKVTTLTKLLLYAMLYLQVNMTRNKLLVSLTQL